MTKQEAEYSRSARIARASVPTDKAGPLTALAGTPKGCPMTSLEETAARNPPPAGRPIGASNRLVAWTGFCLGVASGALMGLWAFDGPLDVPGWIGKYGDTSRRLLRLGHIAFFGIGILNLLLVRELPLLQVGYRVKAVAAWCMNAANIFLPFTLIAAAVLAPLKYLLPLPVMGAVVALCVVAWDAGGIYRGEAKKPLTDHHLS